jgi:hypothetical protein
MIKYKESHQNWINENKTKANYYKYKNHFYRYLDILRNNKNLIYKLLVKNVSANIGFTYFINDFMNYFEKLEKYELKTLGLYGNVKAYRLKADTSLTVLENTIKQVLLTDGCNPKKQTQLKHRVVIKLTTKQYNKFITKGGVNYIRHLLDK